VNILVMQQKILITKAYLQPHSLAEKYPSTITGVLFSLQRVVSMSRAGDACFFHPQNTWLDM
jgi:hypothetical protein